MVAGDLVNTASRIQSVATRARFSSGSRRCGRPTPPSPTSTQAPSSSRARMSPCAAVPGRPRRSALRRAREQVHGPRAAVRRAAIVSSAWSRSCSTPPQMTGRSTSFRSLGVGGIGKSRLTWEFNKYIDGLADDVWWHRGRCLAYGEGVAFWALAEMVRGRAGILEDEESASAARKLASLDRATYPGPKRNGAFVEPRLGHLLGSRSGAAGDQENLFAAWRIFFERIADQGPVRDGVRGHPLGRQRAPRFHRVPGRLVARPSHLRADARTARALRAQARMGQRDAELHLDLPRATADRGRWTPCSVDLIPGLPEDVASADPRARRGVPLYAVETVRMLVRPGILVRENGAFRLEGSVDTIEVPESLQALIAARLDGLDPGRAAGAPGRRGPGPDVHPAGPGGDHGAHGGRGRVAPRFARPQGSALDLGRPADVGSRPVRVPPGPREEGRLRHDVEAGTQVSTPGGCLVPPIRRRRGRDRGGCRFSLPRCVPRRSRRRRRGDDQGRCARDPGEGERASGIARGQRGGAAVRRARDRAERRPDHHRRAPRARRRARGGAGGHDRRRTLQALDRDLRVPGCDASRGPRLGAARRADVGRRATPRGARGDGSRLRRPGDRGAGQGSRGARGPARPLHVLRRRSRSRGRADREGTADRGGTRSARGALASHDDEGADRSTHAIDRRRAWRCS